MEFYHINDLIKEHYDYKKGNIDIDNYNHGKSTFENAIKGLIDIKTIPYIWQYDTEQKKDFLKILDFIDYISVDSNNDKLIEYDTEYFKKKFVTLNK